MEPKVSIIIPVYNTQMYIKECLENVRNQKYDNIEIILVDDGSTDESPRICDEYAREDSRIKVIHKQNEGPGLTKNVGLNVSEGEYIAFVDSDDKLDGDTAISNMVNAALKNDADVVAGSFRRFNEKGELGINVIQLKNGEDVMTPDFRFRGFYQFNHLAYEWGKLYKKAFIIQNGIQHGSYSLAEDKAFNMRVYALRPKYVFIDKSVYCYRVNEDSLTSKYRKDLRDVWVASAVDFSKFLKERKIKLNIGDLSAFHIWLGSFFIIKQELQAGKNIFYTTGKLKKYAAVPYVRKAMKSIIAKDYTKGIKAKIWRWLIWGTTMIFNLHLYLVFTMGIALFMKLSGDAKVTKRRYK